MVSNITEDTLHHPTVAIEYASNAPTEQSFSAGIHWQKIHYSTHLMMSVASVRDKPNAKLDTLRLSRPSKIMGRRPMKSDN